MNMINYNQAVEALDKERQLLLNREMYEAEHILVHHAINVVAELPIIRQPEIVRCQYCKHLSSPEDGVPFCGRIKKFVDANWFCADGDKRNGKDE